MDVKAIINTHSLAYVPEEFKSEFVLTSAHFGMGNQKNDIPFCADDCEDSDYYSYKDRLVKKSKFVLGIIEIRIFIRFKRGTVIVTQREPPHATCLQ